MRGDFKMKEEYITQYKWQVKRAVISFMQHLDLYLPQWENLLDIIEEEFSFVFNLRVIGED